MVRISSFLLILFLLATALTIKSAQAVASSEIIPVRLTATVVHAQLPPYPYPGGGDIGSIPPSSFYSSKLSGSINMRFIRDGSSLEVELLLGTSESASHLNAIWTPGGIAQSASAGPVQMCIARSDAGEQQFNSWMKDGGRENPTLIIPLQPASPYPPPFPPPAGNESIPVPANSWTNPSEVLAQLFVRRCGQNGFQEYGDLSIPAGALRVLFIAGHNQVSLSANQAIVSNISQDIWAELLSSCGNSHVQLPGTPTPGASTDLIGLSVPSQQGSASLGDQISRITLGVDSLVANNFLSRAHGRQLTRWLDRAESHLRVAKLDPAIRDLEQVQHHIDIFQQTGKLSPAQAQPLSDQAAIALLTALSFSEEKGQPPLVSCSPQPPCDYTTFYVNGGTKLPPPDRNGSTARPFKTLTEALSSAASRGFCGVELVVVRSTYTENLEITRNTKIIGSGPGAILVGSIVNNGPYSLHVESLRIERSPAPGAIVVINNCASTTVRFVTIDRATRNGIRQRGGSLKVQASEIRRTVAEPGVLASGTGLYLTGGVHAALGLVSIEENQSGALVAATEGTEVNAFAVVAERNRANPFLAEQICQTVMAGVGVAAVELRFGARLNMEFCSITDNENIGLYAHNGAQVEFTHGIISGTRAISACSMGGVNVMTALDAEVSMRHFTLLNAALCSLQIVSNGSATISDGQISDNLIGVNVQVAGFDLARVTDGIIFINNDRNIDVTALPVPDPGISLDE